MKNPTGPKTGFTRVVRGGAWRGVADCCRSAYRGRLDPGYRDYILSFRLARIGPLRSFTLNSDYEIYSMKQYTPYEVFQDTVDDFVGPKMVFIPGGKFRMGSDDSDWEDERPAHEVELDDFTISQFPVTVGEYMQFVEETNSHYPEWLEEGSPYHIETGERNLYRRAGMSLDNSNHPITGISWHDAVAYAEWLSEKTGEKYTLPTEAQWEYACRAGSTGAYCFGDDIDQLENYAWYGENSDRTTHPVGEKRPNAWGLYDMHGNVWEWVMDWYGKYQTETEE